MALTDNLLSYWKFDESSGNASDSVGGLTLTNNGTATFTAGKINNCATLNGSSQYFSNTDPASMDGMSQFSASFWLNPSSLVVDQQPFTKWGTTLGTNQAWRFIIEDHTGLKMGWNIGDGSSNGGVYGSTTIGNSAWAHIVLTWNGSLALGSRAKMYVNGSDVTTSDTTLATMLAGTADLIVGNRTGLPAGGYYNGSIDEVGVWSRALTSGEVSSLYNSGSGLQYPFGGGAVTPPKSNLLLMGVG
jgi:hypothetical protein